ncbi:MAG TPA: hypothetical protein VK886_08415 [Vicinamibacterales bacterium]|nr:hypothetical protein [Vicinamibacterales bacterium]
MAPKARRRLLSFGAALAVVALLLYFVVPPAPEQVTLTSPADPLALKGALHVHTVRSDGGGSVDDAARDAAAAGLAFLVFMDHGDGRRLEPPKYRSGVLCIDGAEISTDQGHVAALGMRSAEYRLAGEARDVIDDIHRLGGVAIVAHPDSPKRELAWEAWDTRFDGLEWLNADSQWRDESGMALARAAIGYWFRPAAALAGTFDRPDAPLERADAVASRRFLALVAGHDAHARLAPEGSGILQRISLPSYRAVFGSFAVRALLDAPLSGRAEDDAARVTSAIRHGRVFSAIDGVAAPARLAFRVRSGPVTATIGDRLIPAGPLEFDVSADAPDGARIVLLRDGHEVGAGPPPRLQVSMQPAAGAYRIEVRLARAPGTPPVPWIVSSPIFVGLPAATAIEPVPLPLATIAELSSADDVAAWTIEHAPDSTGVVSASRIDGSLQVTYALGREGGASPYAALVRPLSMPESASAIEFRVSADRPMRVSVQLRAPGGADGQRWRRSIFADAEPRRVRIDFDDFRPVPGAQGPVPRTAVNTLLFVVDTVNTDPGAEGVVSILEVRVLGGAGAAAR